MGCTSFALHSLPTDVEHSKWFTLRPCVGCRAAFGQVQMSMRYHVNTPAPSTALQRFQRHGRSMMMARRLTGSIPIPQAVAPCNEATSHVLMVHMSHARRVNLLRVVDETLTRQDDEALCTPRSPSGTTPSAFGGSLRNLVSALQVATPTASRSQALRIRCVFHIEYVQKAPRGLAMEKEHDVQKVTISSEAAHLQTGEEEGSCVFEHTRFMSLPNMDESKPAVMHTELIIDTGLHEVIGVTKEVEITCSAGDSGEGARGFRSRYYRLLDPGSPRLSDENSPESLMSPRARSPSSAQGSPGGGGVMQHMFAQVELTVDLRPRAIRWNRTVEAGMETVDMQNKANAASEHEPSRPRGTQPRRKAKSARKGCCVATQQPPRIRAAPAVGGGASTSKLELHPAQ